MKLSRFSISIIVCTLIMTVTAQSQISKTWVADLGNGMYRNPIIYADYSDPDVCRVGDDFYMTASSFNCIPGLPILHSKDLVNWKIVGHAIEQMPDYALFPQGGIVNHGGYVWAPSIRYHDGEFYIYYGDPDVGIFMTKAKDPAGEWEPLILVKAGKGLIDPCPLFDDDGKVYLAHAYAGSRAGIKSLLAVTRLTEDGKKAIGESKVVYDGHDIDPTIEGAKFHKRDGKYYIFAPAGGVSTGWQTVLRGDSPFGPFERRMVMNQGETIVNGPHQGAWVDTPTGEDWFIHFQDVGEFGRITHLQPMVWKNGWPVIGEDKDGDGCGNPVLKWKKPKVEKEYKVITPDESDEFDTNKLGLQWQWLGNPESWWYFSDQQRDCLSLYSVPRADGYKNLWDAPNLLLQKTPAPNFRATMKLKFIPDQRFAGEQTGLIVMGMDYGALVFERTETGFSLSQVECLNADKGRSEKVNAKVDLKDASVYLQVRVSENAECNFYYSLDGRKFNKLGNTFKAREGKWIGAKVGTFCMRPRGGNDGGRVDVDWFRIDK